MQTLFEDDNGCQIPIDYTNKIAAALRKFDYKVKSDLVLQELNWRLNRIQQDWGNYKINQQRLREVGEARDALLDFKRAYAQLIKVWARVKSSQAAKGYLFEEFKTSVGRQKKLFSFGTAIESAEMNHVLQDVTQHRLNKALPSFSGPIPIAPLLPDLRCIRQHLQIGLATLQRRKGTRIPPSTAKCCEMLSSLVGIVGIEYSSSAIRNGLITKTGGKLPATN